jgi:hypothetical protein
MERDSDPPRRETRSSQRSTDRQESAFLAPAMASEATSSMAGFMRPQASSDDEKSAASMASRSSVTAATSKGKKRKIIRTTPDVPEDLVLEMRTTSTVDISAELIRRVEEIIKVAMTSSNFKETYIKNLKEAASSIDDGTMEMARKTGPTGTRTTATRIAEARMSLLEAQNADLQKTAG